MTLRPPQQGFWIVLAAALGITALQTLNRRFAHAQALLAVEVPLRRDIALRLQRVLITRDGDLQACRN